VKAVFADTFFFQATLNKADRCHEAAVLWSNQYHGSLVTTVWVVTEMADALSRSRYRHAFAQFYDALKLDFRVTVIPCDQALWERGLKLYLDRPDKEWSLTDCISFVVMRDQKITDALTADRHFQQAGFVTLFAS
jgi:hypothetical protein